MKVFIAYEKTKRQQTKAFTAYEKTKTVNKRRHGAEAPCFSSLFQIIYQYSTPAIHLLPFSPYDLSRYKYPACARMAQGMRHTTAVTDHK